MATVNITDRYINADWVLVFRVLDLPMGQEIDTAKFVLKPTERALDSAAIITHNITRTYVRGTGGIFLPSGPDPWRVQVDVPRAENAALIPQGSYYYKLYITDVDLDLVDVVADGSIVPK